MSSTEITSIVQMEPETDRQMVEQIPEDKVPSTTTTTSEPDNAPNTDVDQENLPVSPTSPVSNGDSDDDTDEFKDAEDNSDAPTAADYAPDYEAACQEEPEEDLAPIDGSIISHILTQARASLDLTKITLPTFILERRSFLEMLADFLAHPDEFVKIADFQTPRERFIQVVKWYLSAFHAGRRSPVPKKPYNPILGEIFQCYYDIGQSSTDGEQQTTEGPVPWASDNHVTFIAEQTSHHPPIGSFYAECPAKRIQIDGCLWTKSRFLGLSIGVNLVGDATLTLLDHDESYAMTFPSAYGRSILGTPWFEMGGKISIDCAKTGYSASIDFLTKPLINGRKHQILGILYGSDKKEFCRIDGEWNGVMNMKYSDMRTPEVFFDTKSTPIVKKIVRPIVDQEANESRRLWKDVTYYLKAKQLNQATLAKSSLEQTQRQEAKERAEKGLRWQTKYFTPSGDQKWTYGNKLTQRLNQQS